MAGRLAVDTSYIGQLIAGIFYLVVGAGLLQLGRRTRQTPERLLGVYFLFTGLDYSLYTIPVAFGFESVHDLTAGAALFAYAIAVVALLLFTRGVFRRGAAWADWLTGLCTLALFAGVAGSFARGDWDGGGADSPAYWSYFLGYTIACAWVASEAALTGLSARKRLRIGLCEPVLVNRYLLWFAFGALQVLACVALFFADQANLAGEAMSRPLDAVLGFTEIASIAMVWLAFFPPAAYRTWIAGAAEPAHA
jgi:hypothetical protein